MFTKNHISRSLEPIIRDRLYRGKAIVVVGPRQVGKTTLLKRIAADLDPNHLWLDCDEPDIRNMLTDASSDRLKNMVGRTRMVIIDEAQRVRDIGITLKLMVDQIPDTQLMVSGSSALIRSMSL